MSCLRAATEANRRPLRILTVIDEHSRECVAFCVERRLSSHDVLMTLAKLFIQRGTPDYLRSDNGAELTAKALRSLLQRLGVKTLFIEPGSLWKDGYNEPFDGKLRDELLNREIFYALWEAKVLVERWRKEYNHVRPHGSLGYRPSAPEATEPPPIEQAV